MQKVSNSPKLNLIMRSFLVRKINNFTKTLSLRAKLPNTYGARLYNIDLNFKMSSMECKFQCLISQLIKMIFT